MTEELNPNDPDVRELRDRATEYADRVLAGEEPWKDAEEVYEPDLAAPSNDDVGETGESDDEPEEISDEVANERAKDDTGEAPVE